MLKTTIFMRHFLDKNVGALFAPFMLLGAFFALLILLGAISTPKNISC